MLCYRPGGSWRATCDRDMHAQSLLTCFAAVNVIISANSDERVLGPGMIYYFGALGFSENCLGADPVDKQQADLGDGNGSHNQSNILRWNYGDFNFGSCQETVHGGNHFRLFVRYSSHGPRTYEESLFWCGQIQNGNAENTGAFFLA